MPSTPMPEAAYIEIVERTSHQRETGIIVPNDVRINGVSLLAPAGEAITVHEVSTDATEPVKVTLTLFARRVEFKSEAANA